MSRREAPRGELAEAEDDREQVVEVVRDPAGEEPDRLHLLRLPELLLQPAYPSCPASRRCVHRVTRLIGSRQIDCSTTMRVAVFVEVRHLAVPLALGAERST